MMYHYAFWVWSPVGKASRNARLVTKCGPGAQQKHRKIAIPVELSVT